MVPCGEAAGETAGFLEVCGQVVGEAAGETAGPLEAFGEAAGETAGEPAGEAEGTTLVRGHWQPELSIV